jgi:ABC-type uncharacterized transport system permease subunit
VIDTSVIIDFISAGVLTATPLVFAACGACFLERSGVYAIALEGMMLAGCFAGVLGAHMTGNLVAGIVSGMGGGMAAAFVMGIVSVALGADQIVTALAINILALGATSYLLNVALGVNFDASTLPVVGTVALPALHRIPIVGPSLFTQSVLTYVAYALVPLSAFVLFRTPWGLNVRAVGDHPRAADTVGIDPTRIRYSALVACGALSGLGGAVLSLQIAGTFTENMTGGRGFLALAAVIFGGWNPLIAGAAALLFGFADSLQIRLQVLGVNVSSYFIQMIPYAAAVIALAILGGRTRYAAAIGRAYTRTEE